MAWWVWLGIGWGGGGAIFIGGLLAAALCFARECPAAQSLQDGVSGAAEEAASDLHAPTLARP